MEQREPLYPGGANITWCSHYGEQYRDSPKTKESTTIQSGNHTSGYLSKENENTNWKRYIYPYVHSSIIYSNQDMEAT